jgi:hypothetical protein
MVGLSCNACCGLQVKVKFSFLNFVRSRGTEMRFESRRRHKPKRVCKRRKKDRLLEVKF